MLFGISHDFCKASNNPIVYKNSFPFLGIFISEGVMDTIKNI